MSSSERYSKEILICDRSERKPYCISPAFLAACSQKVILPQLPFFYGQWRFYRVHLKTVSRLSRLPGTSWNGIRSVLPNCSTSQPAGRFSYAKKLFVPMRYTSACTDPIVEAGYRLPKLRRSSHFRGTIRYLGDRSGPIANGRIFGPTWFGNEDQLWRSPTTICAVKGFQPGNTAGSRTLCDRDSKLDRYPFGPRNSHGVWPKIERK